MKYQPGLHHDPPDIKAWLGWLIHKINIMCKISHPQVFCKKVQNFAKFTENYLCRVCFLIKLQASGLHFIKKETLAQVFSREFWEIFKNIFFSVHLQATASVCLNTFKKIYFSQLQILIVMFQNNLILICKGQRRLKVKHGIVRQMYTIVFGSTTDTIFLVFSQVKLVEG